MVKLHTMKVHKVCGDKALYILDLGTRWRWVVSCMP